MIDLYSRVGFYNGFESFFLREFFILFVICNIVVVVRRKYFLLESNRNLGRIDEMDLFCEVENDCVFLDLSDYCIVDDYLIFGYGLVYVCFRDCYFVWGNVVVFVILLKYFCEILIKRFRNSGLFIIEFMEVSGVFLEIIYEVELFDEVVFVKVVCLYGYKFLFCSFDKVILFIFGEGEVIYEVFYVLLFDFLWKWMLVIV